MEIYLFAASIIFVVSVARKKRIRALSPFGIFLAFQTLYNVMPWIAATLGFNGPIATLLSDKRIVHIQLLLAACSNVCFGVVHLAFFRSVRFCGSETRLTPAMRRRYVYLTFPFFVVTCVLCHLYGWHQYTFAGYEADVAALSGMFTVTAYFKYFFVAIYFYYIYRFGIDKGMWILLGEHLIVMVIDGARSTFLPILLVTLFILIDQITDERKIRRVYVLAVAGILLSIGTRALILSGSSLLQDMIIPVTIEGTMGDYPALQSIHGIENSLHPQYTYGLSYIVDPLVWLIPESLGRKGLSSFEVWTSSLSNTLQEKFAPAGGFYYLSEAVAAFSYAGPAIVTTIFAGFLVWVERNKNRHRLLYLAWMPTIGILFIKMEFGNCFKLFLIQFLSIYLLSRLAKLKNLIFYNKRLVKASFCGNNKLGAC